MAALPKGAKFIAPFLGDKAAAYAELPKYAEKLKVLAYARPDGDLISCWRVGVVKRSPTNFWIVVVPSAENMPEPPELHGSILIARSETPH